MVFVGTLLRSKQELESASHHSVIEHELYDDREECIGSLVNKSSFNHGTPDQNVYDEFFDVWKRFSDDPLALIERFGLLAQKHLECTPRPNRQSTFSAKPGFDYSLYDVIDWERSVWQLLHALYYDRLCHKNSPLGMPSSKPLHHSEKEFVNHMYDNDDDLRETQIIVDWLEGKVREEIAKVAEKHECLFNETTVWENTRHLLETLNIDDLKSRRLITHLFPDTMLVGEGSLAQKDISDEKRYLHYLFLCVRGGDLQRAQRLCIQRGDITRAVAMEGWRPFHSSHLSEGNIPPENHTVEGNSTRVLSKCVAWWNAENPALNAYERAIFAAQSGNLNVLLQTMTSGSWEDLLWAHCRAVVESRVDATLRTAVDCGPRANTFSIMGRAHNDLDLEDIGLQLPDLAWLPGSWTLCEAFSKAETVLGWSPSHCLNRLADANSSFVAPTLRPSEISAFLDHNSTTSTLEPSGDGAPQVGRRLLLQTMFYTIFRAIALRDYTEMLSALASIAHLFLPPTIRGILVTVATDVDWPAQITLNPLDTQVLRFLAHLILCLQSLENELPEEHCTRILEAYLTSLILEKNFPLIAEYTAKLSSPVRQTRWYSSFLSGLRAADDRQQCLEFAKAAGLDVRSITRAVIRTVRRRFDAMDRVDTDTARVAVVGDLAKNSTETLADIVGGDVVGYLTPVDRNRIAAIDWLVHDRRQRGEVLVLANSLLRLFIAMRKLKAARSVLERLPLAILDQLRVKLVEAEEDYGVETAHAAIPAWLANTVREHECLLLYLQIRESFEQWYVHFNSAKPTSPVDQDGGGGGYVSQSLGERVASEEAERAFQARLQCWRHEVELSTSSLIKQMESLLTYDAPGWLVDASVLIQPTSKTFPPEAYETSLDMTGMFVTAKDSADEDLGIAGLGDSPHSRKLQMKVLREVCLREVVFMLVEVYKVTGKHAECVRLADLVADSEFAIFKVFNECQMQTLLDQIRDSMFHLQAVCGDPLGY